MTKQLLDYFREVVADYDARIAAGHDPAYGSPIRAPGDVVEAMRGALEPSGERWSVTIPGMNYSGWKAQRERDERGDERQAEPREESGLQDALGRALRELFDEQNGPPLETRRSQWATARENARMALQWYDASVVRAQNRQAEPTGKPVFGSLTARDFNDVTRSPWTKTGWWYPAEQPSDEAEIPLDSRVRHVLQQWEGKVVAIDTKYEIERSDGSHAFAWHRELERLPVNRGVPHE